MVLLIAETLNEELLVVGIVYILDDLALHVCNKHSVLNSASIIIEGPVAEDIDAECFGNMYELLEVIFLLEYGARRRGAREHVARLLKLDKNGKDVCIAEAGLLEPQNLHMALEPAGLEGLEAGSAFV